MLCMPCSSLTVVYYAPAASPTDTGNQPDGPKNSNSSQCLKCPKLCDANFSCRVLRKWVRLRNLIKSATP